MRFDSGGMNPTANGHRVLVVDDEPNIVEVVSMALRFQGFDVESAGTGAGAVAAVGAFKPDVIVLDASSATPLASNNSVRFDAAGTYTFYCLIHPFMQATITVQ